MPEPLLFWDHTPLHDGPGPWVLSQWFPAPFTVAGTAFATAEHHMMWHKAELFGDAAAAAAILADPDPERAKALGSGLAADHPDARDPDRWPGRNQLGRALMRVRELLRT